MIVVDKSTTSAPWLDSRIASDFPGVLALALAILGFLPLLILTPAPLGDWPAISRVWW